MVTLLYKVAPTDPAIFLSVSDLLAALPVTGLSRDVQRFATEPQLYWWLSI
jgi:hypothetical protein